eukprot:UN0173
MDQVQHCVGELIRCSHCKDWYCDYHRHANQNISTMHGGHVCKDFTRNDVGFLAELGRLRSFEQGLFNGSSWAPPARFAKQVDEGVRLFGQFGEKTCPSQLSCGVVVSTDSRDFPYRPADFEEKIMETFGSRLAPMDVEDMLRLSVDEKTVLVSMNWAFCNAENYRRRIKVFEQLRDDPTYNGCYFVIRNDQMGHDLMRNYRDEGSDVFYSAKGDKSQAQNKWQAWFIALAVVNFGVCISQAKGSQKIVTENTCREFLAFQEHARCRRDFKFKMFP